MDQSETSTDTVVFTRQVASMDEIQQGWHELKLRVAQLEAERSALEKENKSLRFLLERVIEHRQKSHGELVNLLAGLVSKLPINDVGVMVSRLVEHNTNVNEVCAALTKGKADAPLPQPSILKALDQTKRDLAAALKTAVEELSQLDTPFETDMLGSLVAQPDLFFSPKVVRANRCFVKGQLPKERIVREFGEPALIFFNDMTTDPKLNPKPKPDEIVLAFKNDFETLFQQDPALLPDKRQELLALHQRIQLSKAPTDQARSQRIAFARLSFILELLHYYGNQNTESPDVVFAQRLPALVEQLALTGAQDSLDEKLILQAESLLAYVINADHRLMIINNMGKSGGLAATLKYVLRLRADKVLDQNEVVPELLKHLIPPRKPPTPQHLAAVLRLIKPEFQKPLVWAIKSFDRIRKEDALALAKALATELSLSGLDDPVLTPTALPPEVEREAAWERIKDLVTRRGETAAIAAAFRERLHAKYDAEEIKQSWLTLIEADAMSLIKIFCQMPYLPDGTTDAIAKPVMETYVSRLTHEKYATTYTKVVNSLKNMFKAKPDSATLVNFMALVKWVDPEAAQKLSQEIGMPVR